MTVKYLLLRFHFPSIKRRNTMNSLIVRSPCENVKTSSWKINEETGDDNNFIQHTGKVRKNFFPYKLMQILSSPVYKDCVAWSGDGQGFFFLDQDKFAEKTAKITSSHRFTRSRKSFIRKLNRWGFKMKLKKGPNYGLYSHKYFKRDEPRLCELMVCQNRTKPKKHLSSLDVKPSIRRERKRVAAGVITLDIDNTWMDQPNRKRNRFQVSKSDVNLGTPCQLLSLETKIKVTELLILEKINSLRWRSLVNRPSSGNILNF